MMGDSNNKSQQIHIVVDPLSVAGQRAAALITLLRDQLNYAHTVILVPRLEISEFPLQNFYRFVLQPHGGSALQEGSSAGAHFSGIPRQHTLTVRADVPEPWNVQSTYAQQDIDNLRCSDSSCGDRTIAGAASIPLKDTTFISYTVKNLLVAGQCLQSMGDNGGYVNVIVVLTIDMLPYDHHLYLLLLVRFALFF
jgi:hypothetical protein